MRYPRGDGEMMTLGDLAHFFLAQIAERKERPLESLGRECVEHVGLVFLIIAGTVQFNAVRAIETTGVVARRDEIGLERDRTFVKQIKFDERVAVQTGVWRTSPRILIDKWVDDEALEGTFEVEGVVGNIEGLGDGP